MAGNLDWNQELDPGKTSLVSGALRISSHSPFNRPRHSPC